MRWGAGHVIEPPLLFMAWGVIHDPFRLEFFVDHQTGSLVVLKEHPPGSGRSSFRTTRSSTAESCERH